MFLCTVFESLAATSIDWEMEHYRLQQQVMVEWGKPDGGPKALTPYLEWMEKKAATRNEVKSYLEEAVRQGLDQWISKFQTLLDTAQESGDYTARLGATMLLRIDYRFGADNWQSALFKTEQFGRPLYTKAVETNFDYDYIKEYARCLMNYAIKDIEVGKVGLYQGRERVFGEVDPEGYVVMPNRNLVIDCERRTNFETSDKGDPVPPCDVGLGWVDSIRMECRWEGWNFYSEDADATFLMEEFFKDQMCKNPDKGHVWYQEQAKKFNLSDGLNHNDGFYGRLFGKVEYDLGSGRHPAEGAKVRLYAPKDDQEWITITNVDGDYNIDRAILHKFCSPFELSADYKGLQAKKKFEGPLEDTPDPSYQHEENLLIELAGEIEVKRQVVSRRGDGWTQINVSGRVPFVLDTEKDPPEIIGEGFATFQGISAHSSGWAKEDTRIQIKLVGWMDHSSDKQPLLNIRWLELELISTDFAANQPIPNELVQLSIFVKLARGVPELMSFPLEDGHSIQRPLKRGNLLKGSSTYILHLGN